MLHLAIGQRRNELKVVPCAFKQRRPDGENTRSEGRALVPVSAAPPVLDFAVLQSDDDFEISLAVVALAKAHFTNSIGGAERFGVCDSLTSG